jgi:hypothetical protein
MTLFCEYFSLSIPTVHFNSSTRLVQPLYKQQLLVYMISRGVSCPDLTSVKKQKWRCYSLLSPVRVQAKIAERANALTQSLFFRQLPHNLLLDKLRHDNNTTAKQEVQAHRRVQEPAGLIMAGVLKGESRCQMLFVGR